MPNGDPRTVRELLFYVKGECENINSDIKELNIQINKLEKKQSNLFKYIIGSLIIGGGGGAGVSKLLSYFGG